MKLVLDINNLGKDKLLADLNNLLGHRLLIR